MTLRKKILVSSVLLVVLPVILILAAWTAFVHLNKGTELKPIHRSAEEDDRLAEAMNVLYTFEAELSDMNWDLAAFADDGGTDVVITPEKERIEELEGLGYHFQVESENGVSFSNMDDAELSLLADAGTGADGGVFRVGDILVIRDSFQASGQTWALTAVYDESRAGSSGQRSLLPLYMVSRRMAVVFLLIMIGCIALTVVLISRWMKKTVLVPLEELKKGADRIAGDDLDHRIHYEGNDEFGDVCGAFDQMCLRLKEAKESQRQYEEDRQELLRGISHDLRSPLTSIKGYAMGLKDGIADTDEKKERYYDAILTRADDLERLTGSLSLLVRLETDNSLIRPERVCLDAYIRQLLEEKASWLADRGIDVDYKTEAADAEADLDVREMQRVFLNLFENSVRYRTAERCRVEIGVCKTGAGTEIRFSDDGPGVSQKHLKHLFESFYRADESRTNPEKGSGIGLAVVKQIVEGQGGQVSASSEKGLCITMTFPLVKEELSIDEENTDRGR